MGNINDLLARGCMRRLHLSLMTRGHQFVWIFSPCDVARLAHELGTAAADPDLPLTYEDATAIMKHARDMAREELARNQPR